MRKKTTKRETKVRHPFRALLHVATLAGISHRSKNPTSGVDSLASAPACLVETENVSGDAENGLPADRFTDSLDFYLSSIRPFKVLTPEEVVALAKRREKGDESARQILIERNLKLVVTIAFHYYGMGVPISDLISEGNIGLMRAVDRFNWRVGAKLGTYAAWWITQHIFRAIANQRDPIRVPVFVQEQRRKIYRAADRLADTLGRAPTDEEIGRESGIPLVWVKRLQNGAMGRFVSLQAPLSEFGDGATFAEVTADTQAESPSLEADHGIVRERLLLMLQEAKLTTREREVLDWRFGLSGGRVRTLEEIGKQFKVTREWIRQIEERAINKLRSRKCRALIEGTLGGGVNLPDSA
ncbi:MAG TPA: RNA polymerase sigma factor RpoD [Candidatus Taylorbacteria bacterium]|nr:MAG: RNA polymerase sigma factor [Parcubacteria group bacterium GW2011_GWA2_47_64]KKU97046.1 MAG: RNA polymerase sigma factor [Parcubacteria group bacterium GW2011_GWC2_48_17]HBV01028.1 RNA polymerase sigma factor RpoD [Candidatus Taylorbacteria bacterium]